MSAEEPQAGQKKGGLESLSHDELVAKCKSLLNIAQKAKKAKDDALEELANKETKFKEELKSLKDKASIDSSQSIQMKKNLLDLQLEFDTSQKKMASLEEEHKVCSAKIKKLEHQLSIEYDKRKNAELLNNNLNEDLNKLTESSGQMRLICKRVMEEKEEIEKDFKEIFQQKIEWTRYLQATYPNESITSVKDWIAILESRSLSKNSDNLEEENKVLKDTNEEMKRKVEKLENVVEDLIVKKDGASSEIASLKNDKTKMAEELNEVRVSRDALLKRMDEVRIETTHLIEHSEKLSEENGSLRMEKERFENSLASLSTEHLKYLKEIEDLKAINVELQGKLERMKEELEEEESGRMEEVEGMRMKLKEMEEMRIKIKEMEGIEIKLKEMEQMRIQLKEMEGKEIKLKEMEELRIKLKEMEGMEIKLKEMEGMEMKLKEMKGMEIKLKEMEGMEIKLKAMEGMEMKFKEMEGLKIKLKEMEEAMEIKLKEMEVMETKLKEMEEMRIKLKEMEGMEMKFKEMEGLKIKLKEMEGMEMKLKEMEGMEMELKEMEGLKIKLKEMEGMEIKLKEMEGMEIKLKEMEEGMEIKLKEMEVMETKLKEMEEMRIQLREMEVMETKLKEMEEMRIQLKEMEVMETKFKEMEGLKIKLKEMKGMEMKLKEMKGMEIKLKEMEGMRMKLERLEQTKLEVEEHLKMKLKETEDLKLSLEDMGMKFDKMLEMKSEVEENMKLKVEEIESLKLKLGEMGVLEMKLEGLERSKLEVEENMKVELEEVESLRIKLLETENLRLKLKEFENLGIELEEKGSELNRLKSDYSLLENEKISVDNKVAEQINKIEAFKSKESDLSGKLNVLEKSLEEKNTELQVFKCRESDLIGKLNSLEEQLKEKNMLKNDRDVLEKEKELLVSDKNELEKSVESLKGEKKKFENREKELLDNICGLEKELEASKCSKVEMDDESKDKLREYQVMKTSLEEYRDKLRIALDENKKTEEFIDDLKCEAGKLNSLLSVVQEERDSARNRLHECQLEKRVLESKVEKLRLEDEENLQNLQDLNDRYLSMEEKLNFIFSENEDLKGKVLELEEMHDNLLKEIENIIGSNLEVLSKPQIVHDFQNKSVKLDSSILLKYLTEIICSLSKTIKEKDGTLERIGGEVSDVKKQLEDELKSSEGLKMLESMLNDKLSSFKGGNIEERLEVLGGVVEDSRFFEDLCDSYARILETDVQEAKKGLKVKLEELKENGWKFVLNADNKDGDKEVVEKKMADEVRAKEEEIAQLQDKNKELKGVAIKMKKKINDLNQLLEGERQKVDAERVKLSQLSAVAKNAQMLQQECDRLADELEECKKTIKQLQKVNDSLENEHKDLQQKYNEKENRFTEIEKDMAAIKTQLESSVSKESTLVKELEEVKNEKHVEEVIRKECEKELIITQDKLRKVQLELDQALLQSQKHTVLTQEKHDYEQQLNQSHQTQTQLEGKLKEASSTLAELTSQLETARRDKDELAVQLTKLTADSQLAIETARIQNEALLNRVSQLEAELRTATAQKQRFEQEATRLEEEFAAYKVRAQSVLRQKEQGGSSAEQEARDKCAELQEMCDRIKAQLDSTLEELDQVKLKLESVMAEKEALDKKCENMNNILVQRNKELDRRMMEHRQHKLSTDTLIQCYKTQLEEKERSHEIELESLRLQISKLSSRVNHSEVDDAKVDVENANFYETGSALSDSAPLGQSPPVDIIQGDNGNKSLPPRPPLIEREDGEGSEGNEMTMYPGSLSNKGGLVPLAKLLSSSLGSDDERDVLSLEKFESLQNEMLASNTRVKHLAALLSEAEKDSALMEEQNAVLKEEIRRLQRCIERQPHAHNVEYLKNVVFKFATLGSGDEKSRLVPVLDTILKLSPEEHKQLTAVAKGEAEQTSGWSSYLPTWQ